MGDEQKNKENIYVLFLLSDKQTRVFVLCEMPVKESAIFGRKSEIG